MNNRNQLKVKLLTTIKKIAELQSISAAAAELNTHQPYLSKLVNDLEKTLGFTLFNRSNAGITTTGLGKEFVKKINIVQAAYDDLDKFIHRHQSSSCGEVSIYGDNLALNFIAKKISPCFKTLHSEVSIKLVSILGEYIPSDSDNWDIIISSLPPRDDSLIAREIAEAGYNCFASPDLSISNLPSLSSSILDGIPCITWGGDTFLNRDGQHKWSFTMDGEQTKIDITSRFSCNNMTTAIEMAKNGLGVVYAPFHAVQEYLDTEMLVPLFDYKFNYHNKIYLIYKKRERQPHIVNLVIDNIIEYVHNSLPLTC